MASCSNFRAHTAKYSPRFPAVVISNAKTNFSKLPHRRIKQASPWRKKNNHGTYLWHLGPSQNGELNQWWSSILGHMINGAFSVGIGWLSVNLLQIIPKGQ